MFRFTSYEINLDTAPRPDAARMQNTLKRIKSHICSCGQFESLGLNEIHRVDRFSVRFWFDEKSKSYSFFYDDFIFAQLIEGPNRSKIRFVSEQAISRIDQQLLKLTSTPISMPH